jgi:catechol 2,3-dioxygenase-like lactoylglutathione lyase family enzyme
MSDVGLTHIALPVVDIERSCEFYRRFAGMTIVHRRTDPETGSDVAWISDLTRPFVIVLIKSNEVERPLLPMAHLGVGCASPEDVDRLCEIARDESVLIEGPTDSGPPVGYWALLRDPDGHTLELSFGQEVGFTVQSSTLTNSANTN